MLPLSRVAILRYRATYGLCRQRRHHIDTLSAIPFAAAGIIAVASFYRASPRHARRSAGIAAAHGMLDLAWRMTNEHEDIAAAR